MSDYIKDEDLLARKHHLCIQDVFSEEDRKELREINKELARRRGEEVEKSDALYDDHMKARRLVQRALAMNFSQEE